MERELVLLAILLLKLAPVTQRVTLNGLEDVALVKHVLGVGSDEEPAELERDGHSVTSRKDPNGGLRSLWSATVSSNQRCIVPARCQTVGHGRNRVVRSWRKTTSAVQLIAA